MDQKSERSKYHMFGIRWKMGVAVGLVVFVISGISFALGVYLHMAITFADAIEMDLYSGRKIRDTLDPQVLTGIFEKGREIYESIPEDVRKDRKSEEYLSHFDELKTDEYEALRKQLQELAEFEDLKWLDIRLMDNENFRYVYLVDSDSKEDGLFDTGYWESYNEAVSTFRDDTEEEKARENPILKPFNMMISLTYLDLGHSDRFSTTTEFYHPDTGEILGYIGTGELYTDYREGLSMYWILHLTALVFFLIVVFFISDFLISRWMVKPLLNLTSAAADYVDEKDKAQNTGHFERVKVTTHDELLLLKNSMVNMESEIVQYVQNISKMTAERERVAVEMEMSSRIQSSFLPECLENYTGEHSFEINALINPAKDVGGDFYDFYVIDDDHIGITVADVSGKGVPASLFMVVSKTLLHSAGKIYKSPAEVVQKVNQQLCEQNKEMMFVTVFFGVYTISEKKLVYVNAGHEDIALYKSSEERFGIRKEPHDILMAVYDEAIFTERIIYLDPGDKLFLYTDGVPEARNPQEEMLGETGMIEALNSLRELSGKELVEEMLGKLKGYAGEAPQFDDITMLVLEVL